MPAEGIDQPGNLRGRAARSSLEHHVFDEMGNACFVFEFVAGAAGEPNANRHRPGPVHVFTYEFDAIGQLTSLDKAPEEVNLRH